MKTLIYAVEDDEGISELYQGAFESDYEIRIFGDGKSFLEAFRTRKPALVILDIMLPDMDGYTILQQIREKDARTPVIVVSAKSDEMSFVKGLNKGADDYMSKPFSLLELMARVKASLRRANVDTGRVGDLIIDYSNYTARIGDKDLKLTLKEFNLLKLLASNPNMTLQREDILNQVWGTDFLGESRTLDMHVVTLREKIRKAGGKNCIATVRGVGYRLEI